MGEADELGKVIGVVQGATASILLIFLTEYLLKELLDIFSDTR